MSKNIGGLAYEMEVYTPLKESCVPGLDVGEKPAAGFSNVGCGDIEATFQLFSFNIEVKASISDQMGGGSLSFDYSTKELTPSKKLKQATDPDDLKLIIETVKTKIPDINSYLEALYEIEPLEYHRMNKGIPFIASKEAREILKKSGHHKNINAKISLNESYITNLYNNKNVYYIQVGGAGLFYMGENPLNLPVPAFKGEVNVEVRLGFSGNKCSFSTIPEPTQARRAELRCIGRMKTSSKSPYTLDDISSIRELFGPLIL